MNDPSLPPVPPPDRPADRPADRPIVPAGSPEPTGSIPLVPITVDDPVAAMLRGALGREAERIQPSPDGLRRIRAELDGDLRPTRLQRRTRGWVPLLAAAAAVVLLGGIGVGAEQLLAHRSTRPPAGPGPSPTATSAATSSPVPVYYLAQENGRQFLVREFRPAPATGSGLAATLRARAEAGIGYLLAAPRNPRYSSLLRAVPGNTQLNSGQISARVTADRITVELPAEVVHRSYPAETGSLAVQQLVWTVTGAVGLSSPIPPVLVEAAGSPAATVFGQPQPAGGFARTVTPDPRAPVWITSFTDGDVLGRQPARSVDGDGANSYRPEVTWQLTRNGKPVAGGTTQTKVERDRTMVPTPLHQRGQWTITVDIRQPGSYQLTVTQVLAPGDPAVPWSDTRGFTVH